MAEAVRDRSKNKRKKKKKTQSYVSNADSAYKESSKETEIDKKDISDSVQANTVENEPEVDDKDVSKSLNDNEDPNDSVNDNVSDIQTNETLEIHSSEGEKVFTESIGENTDVVSDGEVTKLVPSAPQHIPSRPQPLLVTSSSKDDVASTHVEDSNEVLKTTASALPTELNTEEILTDASQSVHIPTKSKSEPSAPIASTAKSMSQTPSSKDNVATTHIEDYSNEVEQTIASATTTVPNAEEVLTDVSQSITAPRSQLKVEVVGSVAQPSVRLRTDISHKKVYTATAPVEEEKMKPFTEEQLNHFYFNPELEQLEYFIDEFLKNANNTNNEFYELVDHYYKSRKRLVDIHSHIESLQETVDQERKAVWLITQKIITAKGVCSCGVAVEQKHKYQVADFKEDISTDITTNLFTLRKIVHESHQLESYNSQVSKIRVENYLYKLFSSYPHLQSLPKDSPVSGKRYFTRRSRQKSALLPHQIDHNIIPVLRDLQGCISVLFTFKRRGYLEDTFDKEVTAWLDILVGTLQRIGTLPDTFFLLNHLLRCPPGSIVNFSKYIQFPSFDTHQLLQVWERPQVHHFVVMLATLTLPVRSRKEFLSKFELTNVNVEKDTDKEIKRSISWTLVDEDKEEEENRSDSYILLAEQDLLAIFEQFPFNELLASLLHIDKSDGLHTHSPSLCNSNDMMRLLSFSSRLVNLLGQIFDTYNLLRYRQFIKQISRTIRLVTQVIADHWLSYRSYHIDVVGDDFMTKPNEETQQHMNSISFSLQRLQIEFDQFFLRASHMIISSHSSGAVQFLSTMPFEAVSLEYMWMMLRMVLDKKADFTTLDHSERDLPCVRTLEVSPSEGIFLLTALSNMAISRDLTNSNTLLEEQRFVETVAKLILEVSFVNTSLTDLYSKNGHDLLSSIANHHPCVISLLLHHANKLKKQLQKVLSYIFESIPFYLWQPTPEDFQLIRSWLMDHFVSSEENILARMILSKLNYGVDKEKMQLFLPRSYHYLVAILLVEAYGILFPEYAGGIKKLNYAALGIIEQVSKLAVSSYNKLMYSQAHNEYLTWSWDVMVMLKLHESDIPPNSPPEPELAGATELQQFGPTVTWSYKTLLQLQNKPAHMFDLQLSPELINVQLANQTNGALAAYVAFAMTKYGHFVDLILPGFAYLQILQDTQQYDAVMRVLSNVLPLFMNCPEKLCTKSFLKLLLVLIHVDVDKAGYTEKLWQYFVAGTYSQKLAALVVNSVFQPNKYSTPQAQRCIVFWLQLFTSLPMWFRDCGILYQMDNLCKVSFLVQNGLEIVTDKIREQYETLIKTQEPKGLLSSVMSWISSNQSISLLPTVTTDFCYYAYVVLTVEMLFEEKIGIWKELSMELSMNSDQSIEQVYKKALSNIKSLYIPPLNMLSIYRFGEQALVTPNDHPFLPFMWQMFFVVFLRKPLDDSGTSSRVGVGLRFFQSITASTFSKKMKSTLTTISSYHKEKSLPKERSESQVSNISSWSMTEKEHSYSEQFHLTLSRFYQGLSLWLEESRLHDANLYLSSLPDVYIPDLLVKIFQGNKEKGTSEDVDVKYQDMWRGYLDSETIEKELETLSTLWLHSVTRPLPVKQKQSGVDILVQITAGQRITKRLNAENKPQPPPPIIYPEPAVPDTTFNILLTRPRLVQDVGHDLEVIVQYAKTASTLCASHVGLDSEFVELLPDLYEMVSRTMTVWIPCDGRKKRKKEGMCTGPAQVNISFRELRLRERTFEILQDNRNTYNQLITNYTNTTPTQLCVSVVHIENIIEKLSIGYNTLNELQRQEIQDSARRLFYLLAQLIDDDIKRCPPAIQFFSSGVEALGQKFIADNSTEQIPLLESIITNNMSVAFLAPHFSPITSLENYVSLYSKVISFMENGNETTVFVLLSKFDMDNWLSYNPSIADQTAMVTLVMMALNKIGVEPTSEGYVVLEVLRRHMMKLLSNNLNEFYSKVVMEILNGSSKSSISVLCWDDLNACLGFEKRTSPRELPKNSLMISHVKESIHFLSGYFRNVVDKMQHNLDPVYEIWQLYSKPLNKLLFGLFECLIRHEMQQANEYTKDQILRELWEAILSVYEPWIVPRTPGNIWTLLRIEPVLSMIQSFVESVRLLISCYTPENGNAHCVLLNYLWCFYYQNVLVSVREEQSLELFHGLFTTLPWNLFCPSVKELSFVIQSHQEHPLAFKFYGCLLSSIDWRCVVSTYVTNGDPNLISRLHQHLLHIFVMMAADKTVLDTNSSKLIYLFTEAKTFDWSSLGLEDTAQACQWYAENVDSTLVLDKESSTWSTLNLFLEVCGFHGNSDVADEILTAKRNLYVKVIVKLLTRCSSSKNRAFDFRFVMEKLLQSIESTISFNTANPMHELITHVSTCLHVLNSITSGPVFDALNSSIETYLLSTRCSMLVLAFVSAISTSIASLEHMVSLQETAISCHFVRLSDDELKNSWVPIFNAFIVPELNKEDFVSEALKQKAMLTLYSYNLQRIPHIQSSTEQFDILTDIVQWCSKLQIDKECESKLLLLWLQCFDLVRLQISQYQYQNQFQQMAKMMLYLAQACQQMGEDKTYSGVLGAIGIGRKSSLSKEFRLTAKSLYLFILCQLPASGVALRTNINSPGAIRNSTTSPNSQATQDAEKMFTTFQSFLKNKTYVTMKSEVQWVIDFISDPNVSIIDGCTLIAHLCKLFFEKENFIAATVV